MSTQAPIVPSEGTPKKFSVMAAISAVTGAITYLIYLVPAFTDMSVLTSAILAPISALAAIITGHRAKHLIRKAEGTMSGKKLANAGLIMGYIYIILCILLVVLVVLGVAGLADLVKNAL
jgi:hypothetical protein